MMKNKKQNVRKFMCDFETTVYEGQTSTEVWASASVEFYTENVNIFHSIDEQFQYFKTLNCDIVAYYHNLKFDGNFWLSYLLTKLKYEQAIHYLNDEQTQAEFIAIKDMKNKTFRYTISDMGQWYTLTIKVNNHIIELRDSLKLLPFSVKQIGKSFKTKHQKLDMEYIGYRYAGCNITDEEKQYIANDVLVVKEALEQLFNDGHDKLTIGSCCMEEYKKTTGAYDYKDLFPPLDEVALDKNIFGSSNADEYIRHSYRGGWCYLVKGKENKVRHNGTTGDVNSLYPSMMHSQSGNYFPIGKPYFWSGNIIPNEAIGENKYYFIRIKTRFYIKENKLPFIQIKGNHLYKGTESLTTSDILNKDGTYNRYYKDKNNNIHDSAVIMTVTMTDYKLMLKHYELVDFEILDGCWFYSMKGIFDNYINHYAEIKMNSKGAKRTEAKLFLNNLYGKLASSSNSSFKVAYVKDDESIGFYIVPANNKKVGHIATGSAITSYARNFTITAAQKNYYGVDKAGFIYADTDSIHCDLPADKIKGITVDPVKFCCWKLESSWDTAIFTRQKTYIEHITHNDLIPVDEPYNDIKCAGMPQKCKDLFNKSMQGYEVKESDNYTQSELKFLATKRDYSDFKVGLCVPGKLLPKRIKGGVLLVDTTYEMR
ncbi:MAG: DNA polymerase type B, organellar and viral [Bacteriophage sp.]|nr:MAG: DNA polymerase type B, organellar and viral [Bacteriophage sp.]